MNPKFLLKYILVLLSLVWYILLYYSIVRSEFIFLISGIMILGGIYFYWLKTNPFSIKEIVIIALVFRASLLFTTPNFSDDCYRFVWDGLLTVQSVNPYEYTPTDLMELNPENNSQVKNELYQLLNSKDYYTVYPPLNQYLFSASVWAGNGSIATSIFYMKLLILLFEIGLLYLIFKFLKKLKLKESLAQIYALNPLVIIELTGNVHFEGVMLFFLCLGLFLIASNRIVFGSVAIGMAISIKLIPLLFLPMFLPLLKFKKSILLYIGVGITFLLLLYTFITQSLINNFSNSLNLYFQSFEFNASFYYLFKGISHWFLGYKTDLIGIISPIFIITLAILMTIRLLKRKQLDMITFINSAAILLFIFYLQSSTVHPWYIINLVFLSIFINRRTFLLWSILAFISYFSYSYFVTENALNEDFHSYFWYYFLIAIEYLIVLFFFIFEFRKKQITKNEKSLTI